MTGVVGPNGCGKSNLVEALRWVMGESSYKSMRASSMDDVIFSGSNSRPARNNAEVAIAIDNSTRSAPAAFNDQDSLEIARRIEREAGSSYRINGREVRARDVQILFADASTGARSPALVHQGRIGEIIQAKPEQRRRVLEEAAGIAGLHARRHEAELRLKAAETNLLRVEDVIGQLAAQIDGLKKQARQAIRYRTVSSQVRKAEATLYHLRWTAANGEVTEAEHAKDLCVRTVAERVGAEAEASKRQALAAASLPELREAEARAGAALHRLNVALQDLDREEARAKDRIAELDLRLVQFAADTEREQRLAADAEQAIARLAAEEETIRAEARESAGRRSGVDARVAEADAELSAAEKIFSDLTTALADLTAQRNRFENAAREQSERIARISSEIESIERELKTLHSADSAPLAAAVEGTQAALTEAEAAAIAAEAAHNVARAELEAAREASAESEKRVQRLETEAKTLSKMLSLETRSLWPPVIDHISVEKGYEKALGAALGDDLDAPVDPSSPMHWTEVAERRRRPDSSRWRRAAGSLREGAGATRAAARANRRGRTRRRHQACRSSQDRPAAGIARRRPLALGWLCRGRACADRRRPAPGATQPFCRDRQRTCERAQRSRGQAPRAGIGPSGFRFSRAARKPNRARRERDLNRQAARLSALAEARARLNMSRDEATTAKTEAESALGALAPAANIESKLAASARRYCGQARQRSPKCSAEQQAIVREAEHADRRLTALSSDKAGWIERQQGARDQIATLEQRIAEARRDRTELENAPQVFAEKRRALITEVHTAETARRACADRLQEAENALAEADRDARAALEAASAAREDLARAEERFEGAKRRLTDIGREIHDMLEIEPAAVAELAEIGPTDPLPDLAEIEERLERLRRERERLGAVNLRAEEELREVETQHTSLTTERDDLVEAIKKLRLGIQSLNREARERLLTSFEQVNKHFQHLFAQLFGGGTAELQLDRKRGSARSRPGNSGQAAGQEAGDIVAALRRRAGADRAGADLRRVPDQSGADLRAGRSGRAARRS